MTKDEWIIRAATLKDLAALKATITAAYADYAKRIDNLPDVAGGIEDDIASNLVFVTENNGRIGGGMILTLTEDFLHLANIAVSPAFGGQGLGRRLMQHAEQEAKRLNFSEMQLSTHVLMPENVALYTHLGWRETARTQSKVMMAKSV